MKKKIIPVLIIFILIAAAAIVILTRRGNFYYAGTIEATEVDVSSRITGIIESINADEGGTVTKGQELVKLSIEDIEIASAQAKREYERAQRLLKAGSMNKDSFDKIKLKHDDLALKLSWGSISSPVTGTVLYRYYEPGEFIAPGARLLTLGDLRTVWTYIYAEQPKLSKISLGMKLKGIIPDSESRKIEGTIIHIRDKAEFTPKNVQTRSERTRLVYGVKVSFDNADGFLKPGMTVELRLPE